MSSFIIPDCLVLKYEEVDPDTQKLDTTIYILFDSTQNKYIIRGQRRWENSFQTAPYSFECESAYNLASFLLYILDSRNIINETMYNYDNLPKHSNDITYDFLKFYDHVDYEIVGYDNIKFRKSNLLRSLRMLHDIKNDF